MVFQILEIPFEVWKMQGQALRLEKLTHFWGVNKWLNDLRLFVFTEIKEMHKIHHHITDSLCNLGSGNSAVFFPWL